MKFIITVFGIIFAISLFIGYVMYKDLSYRLDTEQHLRKNHAAAIDILVYKYLEVLISIERRQVNVEKIMKQSTELNLTFENLRVHNISSIIERPWKRRQAIGDLR